MQGQNYFEYLGSNFNNYSFTGGLMFVSGASDGLSQTLAFHYWKFEKKFPKANRQFWDNNISWENKYRDYPIDKRPAYFGSKTFLAWTTDGYHLSRTISNTAILSAVVVNFDGAKKWHWYIYDFVIFSLIKSVGFHLVYTIAFDT